MHALKNNRALLLGVAAAAAASMAMAAPGPAAAGGTKMPRLSVMEEKVPGFIIRPQARGGEKVAASLQALDATSLAIRANVDLKVHRAMSGGAHVLRLDQPVSLSAAEAIAKRMMRGGGIDFIEPDRIARPFFEPNDPLYREFQWHFKTPAGANAGGASLPAAWDMTRGAASVVVAVLDTGIIPHRDINLSSVLSGYDFMSNFTDASRPRSKDGNGRDADPADPGDWAASEDFCFDGSRSGNNDSTWHGTHVAGIIAAAMSNGVGGSGIAPNAKILPVRVLGTCGGVFSDIIDGMRWAAGVPDRNLPAAPTQRANIINLSLGGVSGTCSKAVQDAVNDVIRTDATRAGTVVVAATGNENTIGVTQPANCDGVIAVTAHTIRGNTTNYANIGNQAAISGPGGGCDDGVAQSQCIAENGPGILSTINNGLTGPRDDDYGSYAGTSMAAPHVAGVAALMLSRNGSLVPAQIKSYLQSSARPLPPTSACVTNLSYVGRCGAGLLDAAQSLATVDSLPPYFASLTPTLTVAPGAGVTLNATAAAATGSIAAYQWTQVSGTPVTLANPAAPDTTFTAPGPGILVFRINAADDAGRTTAATVTVRVNSPPVPAPSQNVVVGSALNFKVASDPDDDPLRFEARSDLPEGASFDGNTGIFDWPNAMPAGNYSFAFSVTDGDSVLEQSVAISVAPRRSGGGGSLDFYSLSLLALAAAGLRIGRLASRKRAD